jgi:hypothetical protein
MLLGWYKDITGRAPKPTFRDEEKTCSEYQKLFTEEELPGDPISIHIHPHPVVDVGPPSEEEVVKGSKKMKLNKSPGANGICADYVLIIWHK